LYVIGLNRLPHLPRNCGIQTQTVFFINATGKGKLVYTVELQPEQANDATEGDSFPASLFCCIKFPISLIHLYFDTL
jgi:hypothetical protein